MKTKKITFPLILSTILFSLIFLLLTQNNVYADTTGDWEYTVYSSNQIEITGYTGNSENVVIPESIEGCRVTSLDSNLFKGHTELKSVTIPKYVKTLGYSLFKDCTNLTSVKYNAINASTSYNADYSTSTSNCADYAIFYNAGTNSTGITVTFGSYVTNVPDYIFATALSKSENVYCKIKSVVFSSSVTTIEQCAFLRCYDLTSITWASGLITIENNAFNNCISLTAANLPSTVKEIDSYAFYNCTKLKSITIPKSTKTLGYCIFSNCTNLTSVKYNAINASTSYNADYSTSTSNCADYAIFYNAGTNSTGITVTFGSYVTNVPDYIFATALSKSENVYCKIKSVVFSSSVTTIEQCAFLRCYDLTSITWASGLITIENNAFNNCISLTAANLPSTVKEIDSYAFYNCTKLKSITIPKSTKTLGYCIFSNCTNLTSVKYNAINASTSYNADYSTSTSNCADYAIFYNAGTNSTGITVTFGSYVTNVPDYIFATALSKSENVYCKIKSVVFSSSVTTIEQCAFLRCYDLTSITWASGLITIENNAFNNCISLTAANLPSTVKEIDSYAFYNCTKLKSITIPKSTKTLGYCIFSNCTNLTSIIYNAINASTSYNADYSTSTSNCADYAIFYKAGIKSTGITVTFGSTVKSIPDYLFATALIKSENVFCNIKTVKIASSITSIGDYAFYKCYNLKYTICNARSSSVGDYVFSGCSSNCIYALRNSKIAKYAQTQKLKYSYLDPTNVSGLKATTGTATIKLTWNKSSNVTGYIIYRYNNTKKAWEKIGTTTSTSYTIKKLSAGTTYQYAVKSYKSIFSTNYSCAKLSSITTTTNPAMVSFKVTPGKNKATISWSKVKGATGYIVYYKTSAKGSWKRLKVTTGTSFTKTGLTKNKTYYFTVKAYKSLGGKNYNGSFSTKSAKIK